MSSGTFDTHSIEDAITTCYYRLSCACLVMCPALPAFRAPAALLVPTASLRDLLEQLPPALSVSPEVAADILLQVSSAGLKTNCAAEMNSHVGRPCIRHNTGDPPANSSLHQQPTSVWNEYVVQQVEQKAPTSDLSLHGKSPV